MIVEVRMRAFLSNTDVLHTYEHARIVAVAIVWRPLWLIWISMLIKLRIFVCRTVVSSPDDCVQFVLDLNVFVCIEREYVQTGVEQLVQAFDWSRRAQQAAAIARHHYVPSW